MYRGDQKIEFSNLLKAKVVTNVMNDLTIFIHVYYKGSWALISAKCGHLIAAAQNVIVSACHNEVIAEISAAAPHVVIQKVSNKGKDIGGKLAGLSYYYQFCKKTSYFAFLHDKISPQTLNAEYWFDKLYDIFSDEKMDKINRLFRNDKHVGVVGSKAFLKNEYSVARKSFDTTNNDLLKLLLAKYNIRPDRFDYIGGTIFVARCDGFDEFFQNHSAIGIRAGLEEGNVLDLDSGTNTHSWERLLCFIPQSTGYKVAGV